MNAEMYEAWVRSAEQKNDQAKHLVAMMDGRMDSQGHAWTSEFMEDAGRSKMHMPQTNGMPGPSMTSQFRQQDAFAGQQSLYQPSMGMYGMGSMGGMGSMSSFYSPMQDQGKGKGKSRDADFEAAFAQFAASMPQTEEKSRFEVVGEDVTEADLANGLNSVSLDDKKAEESADGVLGTDFETYVHPIVHSTSFILTSDVRCSLATGYGTF